MKEVAFSLVFLLISVPVFAEQVVLKSGKVLEGEIVEKTDTYLKVDSGKKVWKIPFNMMEKKNRKVLKKLTNKMAPPKELDSKDHAVTASSEIISQSPYMLVRKFYLGNKEIASHTYFSDIDIFLDDLEKSFSKKAGESSYRSPCLEMRSSTGNVPDGEVIEYSYVTGGKVVYTYKNNLLNGPTKNYSPKETLISEYFSKDNCPHGKSVFYNDDESIDMESLFEKGAMVWSKMYHSNGEVAKEMLYEEGNPRTMKTYAREGELIEEYNVPIKDDL
ncbi:MAG: hypothetical protein KAJ18_09880 [Candidatus Omnitrophica bacterium]|nr:hypothetical protein [Candidatus Omnitrophota bacterium]